MRYNFGFWEVKNFSELGRKPTNSTHIQASRHAIALTIVNPLQLTTDSFCWRLYCAHFMQMILWSILCWCRGVKLWRENRSLQVLCHAIVNLLPGGEAVHIQEQHKVTWLKLNFTIHRCLYSIRKCQTPLPPPRPGKKSEKSRNPSRSLISLSRSFCCFHG